MKPHQESLTTTQPSRSLLFEMCVFAALVTAGAAGRLLFEEIPNFAPVAATALFAGYFFRRGLLAILTPLSIMVISDAFIGGYDWRLMIVVYSALLFPVLLRGPLRKWLPLQSEQSATRSNWWAPAGLLGCCLLSSLLFFITTNFACWVWYPFYEKTPAGLLACYTAALPFFRYTLAGDFCFGVVLFASYALSVQAGLLKWRAEAQLA